MHILLSCTVNKLCRASYVAHGKKKELTARLVTRRPTDFAVRREWDARQRMSTLPCAGNGTDDKQNK
jgi:hypothetical protein